MLHGVSYDIMNKDKYFRFVSYRSNRRAVSMTADCESEHLKEWKAATVKSILHPKLQY